VTAVEVANAYVTLTTKMPGVKREISSALGGSDVDGAVKSAGVKFGATLTKAISGVAVAGIAAVGATAAAGLGTALVKGFQRLNAIDTASAKLRGLGNDAATVDTIMSNALASVKGTAFGLGDAAGVAAQVVAAGIAPGADLEKVLKGVANSAAAAGTGLGEMGSIYAKAATQANGVQNDVISQLADRGIPVYQALADQLGVTAGEVFGLASAGKISFQQFQDAAIAASGTVASELGGTVKGSLDNLMSSLGRIGAGLLGGVFGQLAPTIQAVTGALGPLEVIAGNVGQKIGQFLAPAFELIQSVLTSGFDFSMFGELLSYLSPLGLAFKVLEPILPVILNTLMMIGQTVGGALISAVQALLPALQTVASIFADVLAEVLAQTLPVFVQLGSLIGELVAGIAPLIVQLVSALVPALSMLAPIAAAILPVFRDIIPVLSTLVQAILPVLSALIQALAPIFTTLMAAIIPIIEPILELVSPLLELVTTILQPLINLLGVLIPIGLIPLQAAFEFLGPVIAGVAEALSSILMPMIQLIQDVLSGLVTFLTGVFTGNWEQAWQGVQDIFSGIWEGIRNIAVGVINGIIDLINGFIGGLNGFGGFLSDLTGGAVGIDIGTIPHLAQGATVQPRRGGTLAVLAEAGRPESVVDTGLLNAALENGIAGSRSGPLVVVNPGPGMDEQVIGVVAAREISWQMGGG